MNIWQSILLLVWGPTFAALTPYLLHPYLSQYLTGFVDYVVYIFIFAVAGLIVADIPTTIAAKIITEVIN